MKIAAIFKLNNQFSKPLKGIIGDVKKFKNNAGSAFKNVGAGINKIGKGALAAGGIFAGLTGSALAATMPMLNVAEAFEGYQIRLEALEGSSEKASKSMDWITDFATKTPLQLDQVVEGFANLKTFGLDPMDGTFMALVDTMAMSGQGAEHLSGLTLALGQAWTKGKLQGEEALQLIERGVPVWDLLGKKYNMTAGELQELSSKGKLGRDVIKDLIELMGERAAGSSEKFSKSFAGIKTNIADIAQQFQLMVMNAGLFDFIKDKAKTLLDTFKEMQADGSLKEWAKTISDNIVETLTAAWEVGKGFVSAVKKMAGYLQIAADALGGWNRLAAVLVAIPFLSTLMGIVTGFALLAKGLIGLSIAAGPIGLIVAAIAALAYGAYLVYKNWDAIGEWFMRQWDSVKNFDFSSLIPEFSWDSVFKVLNWISYLSPIRWLEFIPGFSWDKVFSIFTWDNVLKVLNWTSYLSPIRWLEFIPGFSWDKVFSIFTWDNVFKVLNWASYLSPIRWLEFIPDFKFDGLINSFQSAYDWIAEKAQSLWDLIPEMPSFSFFGGGEKKPKQEKQQIHDPQSLIQAAKAAQSLEGSFAALNAKAQGLPQIIGSSVNSALALLQSVDFSYQGGRMMETLAAGMRAKAQIVVAEMRKVTQELRNHLPSSPAKTGPLKDIHKLKFGETIAGSIKAEPMVKAMRLAAGATLAAASLNGVSMAAPAMQAGQAQKPFLVAQQQMAYRQNVAALTAAPNQPQSQVNQPVAIQIDGSVNLTVNGNADEKTQKEFAQLLEEHRVKIAKIVEQEIARNANKEY